MMDQENNYDCFPQETLLGWYGVMVFQGYFIFLSSHHKARCVPSVYWESTSIHCFVADVVVLLTRSSNHDFCCAQDGFPIQFEAAGFRVTSSKSYATAL